jgi:DNA-binding GntR family transcriptional regulator
MRIYTTWRHSSKSQGRQPVTHALAVLKTQGFLAQSGRRVLTVTTGKPGMFKAIYQFRSTVESLAAKLPRPRLLVKRFCVAASLSSMGGM